MQVPAAAWTPGTELTFYAYHQMATGQLFQVCYGYMHAWHQHECTVNTCPDGILTSYHTREQAQTHAVPHA